MMTHLVGYDVGTGKFSGNAQLTLHVRKKSEIQVDLPVSGAIKGAHGG